MNLFPTSGETIVNREFVHETVLRQETVTALLPSQKILEDLSGRPFTMVDCTLGGGGHTHAFLKMMQESDFKGPIRVIGIDRDTMALEAARARLQPFLTEGIQLELIHDTFATGVKTLPPASVDALCADFGVSSPQIDFAERGFSLRHDGPLDMRMNEAEAETAKDILESASEQELTKIFRDYGEEPRARKLAQAVVTDRAKGTLPLNSTLAFAAWAERVLAYRGSRVPPATRAFQALRIAVNRELEEIESLLKTAPTLLTPHAHAAFISFHSLEDRLVKRALRLWERGGHDDDQPPNFPHFERTTWGREIPRGGVVASPEELRNNPRAHSARLRIFCFGGQIRSK